MNAFSSKSSTVRFLHAQSPSIMLPLMDNVLCWFGNGCILAMLEPHLAEIGADNRTISITFLLFGLVFALSTPITGIVSSNFIRTNQCENREI